MTEEVLRLGVDPRAAEAGFRRFESSVARAQARAWSLNTVMGSLATSFGALAAARATGQAIRGMIQFDQAMTQSLSIMGDVDAMMRGRMVDAAREVGKALNFGAEQGAEAFFFLASAGLNAEQSIAALPAVAQFARAGMFDFATATDLATDAQSALGLVLADSQANLRNMTRVTDVLVKANTLANASVEQFAAALTNEAGAAMKTFNIDVEEGVAVLAAFADQGIKGQVAGSGFSRILRMAADAAVNNREEMAALGIEFFNAEGNIRNMADIVANLETALDGMSDAQRTASLNAIGFNARIQGILLPLLGTSEAIRGYEAALRDAGGASEDVANRQMTSLENRIGQIRQQFVNWRTEMAESTIPAIEWAIGNVDLLTDAIVGLTAAVGALVALKVGAWALAAGTAFAGWGVTVVSLAAGVRTLAGATALLQTAIGPAGWLMLGITAITGGVMLWRSRQRELNEELAVFEERLRAADEAGRAVGFDALPRHMEDLTAALVRAQDEMRRLQSAREAVGTFGSQSDARELDAAIAAQTQHIAEIRAQLSGATDAWIDFTNAAKEGVEVLAQPTAPDTKPYEDITGFLADALDYDLKRAGLMPAALTHAQRLRGISRDEARTLEARVEAAKELARLQPAILGSFDRQLESSLELRDATVQIRDLWKEVPEWMNKAAEPLNTLPDVAKDGAFRFRDHWLTAIQVVGASLGGLASQVANVASAFVSGGPGGGVAAMAGMAISILNSDRSDEIRRVGENYERALDAFVDGLTERSRFERLERDAATQAAAVLDAYIDALVATAHRDIRPQVRSMLEGARDSGDMEQVLEWFGPEGQAILEAYRAKLQQIAEQRQRDIDSMQESIAVRLLVAQGRDAEADVLRESIARQKEWAEAVELGSITVQQSLSELWLMEDARRAELAAIRETEDALRQAAQARDRALDFAGRTAALAGDDRGALEASLRRQLEAQMALLQATDMTTDEFDAWVALLTGEVNAALRDFDEQLRSTAQAAHEAAMAEAFRAEQDMRNLQVRLLRAQGLNEEAAALSAMIQLEGALFAGRDAAYLALLQQVHAEEARARSMQESTRAMAATAREASRMASAIGGPQGLRLSLLRWRSLDPAFSGPSIANNTTTSNQTTQIDVGGITVVQQPGEDGATLANRIMQEFQRQALSGSRDPSLVVG